MIKNKIKNIVNEGVKIIPSRFSEQELKEIINRTVFLETNAHLSERCYCVMNNIQKQIFCKNCGKNKPKFLRISVGYREFCSCRCKNEWFLSNTNIKKKIAENVNKYHNNLSYVDRKKQQQKRANTMVQKGIISDPNLRNDFYNYSRVVWHFTNTNNLEKLPNFEKRGRIEKDGTYQLDHMFSILEGFKENIPPYIIGSYINLKMIPSKINSSKKAKCSMNKEKLFQKYFEKYK